MGLLWWSSGAGDSIQSLVEVRFHTPQLSPCTTATEPAHSKAHAPKTRSVHVPQWTPSTAPWKDNKEVFLWIWHKHQRGCLSPSKGGLAMNSLNLAAGGSREGWRGVGEETWLCSLYSQTVVPLTLLQANPQLFNRETIHCLWSDHCFSLGSQSKFPDTTSLPKLYLWNSKQHFSRNPIGFLVFLGENNPINAKCFVLISTRSY